MQIQGSNNKNFFCFEESKFKDSKPILLCNNMVKSAKKKKRKIRKKSSKSIKKNILESKKNKLRQQILILSRP